MSVDIALDRAQQGRQRTVNLDGTFNIRRITGDRINFDLYHWIITTSWTHYWLVVFIFMSMNVLFAVIFYLAGTENIKGISSSDGISDFMQCFFFSNQTFTTVGYGGMHPVVCLPAG
jgi:inward rectifier potassium channel